MTIQNVVGRPLLNKYMMHMTAIVFGERNCYIDNYPGVNYYIAKLIGTFYYEG